MSLTLATMSIVLITNGTTERALAALAEASLARRERLESLLAEPMDERDAEAIQQLAADYFSKELIREMDAGWEARGVDPELLGRVGRGDVDVDDLP